MRPRVCLDSLLNLPSQHAGRPPKIAPTVFVGLFGQAEGLGEATQTPFITTSQETLKAALNREATSIVGVYWPASIICT